MLNVRYVLRNAKRPLSVHCVHFICFYARLLKTYRYGQIRVIPPEIERGSEADCVRRDFAIWWIGLEPGLNKAGVKVASTTP